MGGLITINKKNMAVSIDTVYQRVLAILNKEQRGYITPQEFNLFANQAQLDIFEQYFYDLNQFMRLPGNDSTYGDVVDLLNEKIDIFEKFRQDVTMASGGVGTLPNYYRMGQLSYLNNGEYIEIEKINQNELNHYINSKLTSPTLDSPIYVQTSSSAIQIYPNTINSGVTCNYISKPVKVEWQYQMVLGEALYNSTDSVDFELHASEETELVFKILELAGVLIKDPSVYQIGNAEEIEQLQQEKS